jgi:hypothetical protein
LPRLKHLGLIGLGILLFLCLAPTSQAQMEVSGRYKCTEMKIHGKAAPCDGAPLVLKQDGRFEIRGREGDYRVKGDWLMLSDREKTSRAKIVPGHRLVFQYSCGEGACEVTFERRVADLGKTSLG